MVEYIEKQNRIQTLLAKYDLDALLLRRVSSFAWATCGAASYVNIAVTYGEAALLITPKSRTLITNNNESARLEQEEKLTDQGWNIIAPHWYGMEDPLSHLTSGLRLGTDFPKPGSTDLSADIARLRANLTPPEVRRFRKLGKLCAQAMESAIRAVRPGQSEQRIAARLALETEKRGVQAIVNLVAVDARIFTFRHPLPTARKLEKYAMLVLCGR
jgi:Xaa-Pro aminopeptidase